jgi:hypothetical protein
VVHIELFTLIDLPSTVTKLALNPATAPQHAIMYIYIGKDAAHVKDVDKFDIPLTTTTVQDMINKAVDHYGYGRSYSRWGLMKAGQLGAKICDKSKPINTYLIDEDCPPFYLLMYIYIGKDAAHEQDVAKFDIQLTTTTTVQDMINKAVEHYGYGRSDSRWGLMKVGHLGGKICDKSKPINTYLIDEDCPPFYLIDEVRFTTLILY